MDDNEFKEVASELIGDIGLELNRLLHPEAGELFTSNENNQQTQNEIKTRWKDLARRAMDLAEQS